jgi:hypothetical protein
MKGILIKDTYSDNFYHLMIGINVYATTLEGSFRVLSLKNCEAIENGYDLDELADYHFGIVGSEGISSTHSFKVGFQKALEILGDKKFSSGQLLNAMDLVWQWMNGEDYGCKTLTEVQDKHIQSLQQTEWEVEVIMDRIPADLAPGGWDVFPKLDAENCIILKKIE